MWEGGVRWISTASALGLKIESLGRKWSITPPHLSLLEMQRELYFLALFFQLLLCIFALHLYWSALHGDNRDEINGFPCQFVFGLFCLVGLGFVLKFLLSFDFKNLIQISFELQRHISGLV